MDHEGEVYGRDLSPLAGMDKNNLVRNLGGLREIENNCKVKQTLMER
jgi:hypothetical protein